MIKAIKGQNEVISYFTILAEDKEKNELVEFDSFDLTGKQIILPMDYVGKFCNGTLPEKNHPDDSIWITERSLYKINREYHEV
jgi:hypothetical protein